MARTPETGWNQPAAGAALDEKSLLGKGLIPKDEVRDTAMNENQSRKRARMRNPWAISLLTLLTLVASAVLLTSIGQSFVTRQLDPKGAAMSRMASSYVHFVGFDAEHTRFASKYSLYLYRELGIDEDQRVKGVPVLFIPGNAGSYKQVRSLAAEAAYHYYNKIRPDQAALDNGKRALDFFSVDFNEDITAFHGQTLLDQAEYLNDAVSYILSLYHNPSRSIRDSDLPDPSSVIIIGHSMGGIVARTMLTMPNYQSNSINTIVTLSAPHARAPVSFDAEIVNTYSTINDYWRKAYSQKWANDNPLWHVTLISISGGGLDTVVPSDYSSVESLVPETHGFTVFTSTIPNVWTGMDHLAITWCDQLRKAVIGSLYDVIDVSSPVQTRKRADRMRTFKKWFLTGMEDIAEKILPDLEPKTLLSLEDNSNAIIPQGEPLVIRMLGETKKPRAYLLPVPLQEMPADKKFRLLTNQRIDAPGETGKLEVLFCSVFPLQPGHSALIFSMNMDLSGDSSGSTRFACKNAAGDVISLPASTSESRQPFEDRPPFSYMEYNLEDLAEHQFVAVVDKATDRNSGWVFADFSTTADSIFGTHVELPELISNGLKVTLPATRPMVVDVKIPALHSSLLAYKLNVGPQACSGDEPQLFMPLLRQYITSVYESKYFVNVKQADINLHGVAPYIPPAFRKSGNSEGISLQIWSDPTCKSTLEVSLELDYMGSLGKLWMRYRTLFASFPLLIVALVIKRQFSFYDESGIFMSFSEGMNQCIRSSLPLFLLGLTGLSVVFSKTSSAVARNAPQWSGGWAANGTESAMDFTVNDLLLGSQDPFFWFLVPVFGVMCIGICIALNYFALCVTHILAFVYQLFRPSGPKGDEGRRVRRTPAAFAITSTRQRIATTSVLLGLVITVIPYQFAYLVLCIVHIATCIRACTLAWETHSDANYNFYNYAHSIFVLLLWILPINLPVLVVWIRNLAVHWLTPFSSHHNVLSIMPYILLVETLSTGRMIPKITTRIRHISSSLLAAVAVVAALYGVSYAFFLHQVVNVLCLWLVVVHLSGTPFELSKLDRLLDGPDEHHHLDRGRMVGGGSGEKGP
ncbi:PGAP1-domain-containing protein [Aulographum hederae CBS 113979]|uniref:GPI inositol-deacylase n=1 Tax=Aulographum hederae CBS 113979 TaxID=1176131 RepID=A0A6G1HHK7_9PEZI|nr:PGAP1-domain-containing protein [Aulographum hederae CBS 113979]